MRRPLAALTTLFGLGLASPAVHISESQFCSTVDGLVSQQHERAAATSFCSSYLSIHSVTTTSTKIVTRASTTMTTDSVTVTKSTTAAHITTITITKTTSTVATTTSYPASTTTVDLSNCKAPSTQQNARHEQTVPKPSAWSTYPASSLLSQACSCLSIPTPTSTVVVSTTASPTVTRTDTVTETTTSTLFASATLTDTTTQTVTRTSTTTVHVTSPITTETVYPDFKLYSTTQDEFAIVAQGQGFSFSGLYFYEDEEQGDIFGLTSSGAFTYSDKRIAAGHSASAAYTYRLILPFGSALEVDCELEVGHDECPFQCAVHASAAERSGNVLGPQGTWELDDNDEFTVYAVGLTD